MPDLGVKSHEFLMCLAPAAMILPMSDDLVPRQGWISGWFRLA
jgi:hypothetical protein